MEELRKQQLTVIKIMIFITTFIAIKDLFIFTWAMVHFYHERTFSSIFLAILSISVSILFIKLRNGFIKEKNGLLQN